jgi:polysaccharide biosynthesis protein PslG
MRVSVSRLVASTVVGALAMLAGPTASANLPVERVQHRATVIKVKVDPRLFGVHDASLNSLSRPGTGSIRLWDTGTTWGQLEFPAGHWRFTRLDQIVSAAHANNTSVTLVLGLSPAYAAAEPTDAPDLTMYQDYLRTIMQRYSATSWGYRGIAAYQVWNEANITTFWTGTDAQLAELTKAAYDVRNQVDPGAQIIAPAMVTRLKFEQKAIAAFYATKVPSTGRPVWRYIDAISLNLYPTDRVATRTGQRPSAPEDSIALLNSTRALLAKAKVPASIPVWNTEVNYGMGRAATVVPISDARQVANVMRTYLLNAAQGVKRVNWYAYDMGTLTTGGTLGNTLLTDPTDRAAGTLTPAGVAFTRVQGWMKGTMVGTTTKRPCIADRHGTYTCLITYAHGVGRVYWNPFRSATVQLVRSASRKTNQYGATSRARGGSKLKVNFMPVLVRSRK